MTGKANESEEKDHQCVVKSTPWKGLMQLERIESGVKNQKTGVSPIGEIRVEQLLQGLPEQGIHKFLVASCS